MRLFTCKVNEKDEEACQYMSFMRNMALSRARLEAKKANEKNLE